jgi:hypothetical protein
MIKGVLFQRQLKISTFCSGKSTQASRGETLPR